MFIIYEYRLIFVIDKGMNTVHDYAAGVKNGKKSFERDSLIVRKLMYCDVLYQCLSKLYNWNNE